MNVKRFVGRTARDAMRKLRDELGPDALVLANRPCAEGVEMLAAVPDASGAIQDLPEGPPTMFAPTYDDEPADTLGAAQRDAAARTPPPMSTVSFQDYVRQRLRDRLRAGDYPAACDKCGKIEQNLQWGRRFAAAYGEAALRAATGRADG